ncbi:MAG: type 1 glutamine amidotransferase [Candidatus Riflemargulisbacteria bacterium]
MKLHYLQHEEFEDLGCIRSWAESKNAHISSTKLFLNEQFPEVLDFDFLIILGGSMNVYEDNIYPWLAKEKVFINDVINKDISVLGICLGAQILSIVLGGEVTRNKYTEIGWFPVHIASIGVNIHLSSIFSNSLDVFHWHGDTFTIPINAIKIFSSDGCSNQGFIYKENVIALQFHLETDRNSVKLLCKNCADEIVAGKYIQDVNTITKLSSIYINNANNVMFTLLNYLVSKQ